MRKVFYSISAFAAAAIALISCQKQEISLPEPNMVTVTLTAEKAGVDTKTAAVEGDATVSYVWTDEDKTNLKLLSVSKKDGKETLTVVENPTIAISSDNKTLTITATVEENSTLRATVAGKWTNSNNPRVNDNQSPRGDNFDPNADVLISDDITVSELTDASLTFRRQASINKMTLKGLVAGEKIREIKLSSNIEKSLTGYFNGKTAVGDNSTLTLNYEDVTVAENGEFPVYFSVLPGEAHTLTVVVKSDKNTYTKEFGAGKINFALGKFMKFSVNLEGCGEEVVDTDYSGQWVFVGTNGEKHYAALAYASGNNNIKVTEVTLDLNNEQIASTEVENVKMTLQKITTGDFAGLYTIQDASGNYLYAASSSSNQLKGAKELGGADYYWNIEKETSGVYTIKATKSSNRNYMRFNSTDNVFSCYTSGQKDIILYPANWLVEKQQEEIVNESTLENPYTPAEANALAEKLGTNTLENVYVSGIVNEVSVSTKYGNADYYISADGSETDRFYVYRGKYLEGAAFTSEDQLTVGDAVIVCGTLVFYNSMTPEFSAGSSIISLDRPAAEEYTITVNPSENGEVTASVDAAAQGVEVTLTVTPAEGYTLDVLTVKDAENNDIAVNDNVFTMPASNVTVSATFKVIVAGATTATIKFGTNEVKINAASVTGTDDKGNTWTITTTGTTSFTTNTEYYQVGSSKQPASSITFTTTLPVVVSKVDNLSIKLGGFSGTAGDVTLNVGSTTVGTGSLNATSDVTVSSTTSADGRTITITIDNISKGVKVYSITAEYE